MLFIDAEDSFSWNVVSELEAVGLDVKVIGHRSMMDPPTWVWEEKMWGFGPGPGHPSEYAHLLHLIGECRAHHIFQVGFCLGHQLLCLEAGYEVSASRFPMHGRAQSIILPAWPELWPQKLHQKSFQVQRYNSLAVLGRGRTPDKIYQVQDEILIRLSRDSLSYQFHPESIGTNFHRPFFRPIKKIESMIDSHGPFSQIERHL